MSNARDSSDLLGHRTNSNSPNQQQSKLDGVSSSRGRWKQDGPGATDCHCSLSDTICSPQDFSCSTRLSTQDDRAQVIRSVLRERPVPSKKTRARAVRLAGLDERIRPTNGPAASRSLSFAAGYIYTKLQLVMCPLEAYGTRSPRNTGHIQSRLIANYSRLSSCARSNHRWIGLRALVAPPAAR